VEDNMPRHALVISLVLVAAAGLVFAADDDAVPRAKAAAASWLELTDSGKFGESWDESATIFKSAIGRPEWEKALKDVRSPLGAVKSRTVKSARFTRSLPGVPDGEYVVINFDSQFENQEAAVEMVTPMREKDGSWRVAGYYIK
jgi:hypothetical protein